MPPPHERPKRDEPRRAKGHEAFEFTATLDAPRAAEYLERVAAGIRAGAVGLKAGNRVLQLAPAGSLRLELRAEMKPEKGEGRLEVAVIWRGAAPTEEEPLEIDPAPPRPAAKPEHGPAAGDVL